MIRDKSCFTEDQIRERAQQIWEANGRPEGTADTDWFQAICELEKNAAEAEASPSIMKARTMGARG